MLDAGKRRAAAMSSGRATAPESLQRRQHIEPADGDVPLGAQLFVDAALEFPDERLQSSP